MTDMAVVTDELLARFPEKVTPDVRKGYSGYMTAADTLLEVATALRDEFGYDFLSSVTGVDYLPEGKMEVVYHLLKTTGGSPLTLHVQISRDDPSVPSMVQLYPGAELQEREIWDLFGIKFEGHPDLRRILMWEGFDGHPLRKDWREGYYEEDGKPFKSRWPDGHIRRAEDVNPFGRNVDYPAGFDPEKWVPHTETALYAGLAKVEQTDELGIKTEQVFPPLIAEFFFEPPADWLADHSETYDAYPYLLLCVHPVRGRVPPLGVPVILKFIL